MAREYIQYSGSIEDKIPDVIIPQYDTGHYITFELFDKIGADNEIINLANNSITLLVELSDSEIVPLSGEVLDADNGLARVRITGDVTAETGTKKAQLMLTGTDASETVRTRQFSIIVKESINDDGATESDETYTALQIALTDVNSALSRMSSLEHFQVGLMQAYQEYQNNGGEMTLPEWIATISSGAPGPRGEKGDTGERGERGEKGSAGDSTYTHIRYKISSSTTNMQTSPTSSSQYVGFAVTNSPTAPTSMSAYAWALFKGERGDTGPQGERGETGLRGERGETGATGASVSYYLASSEEDAIAQSTFYPVCAYWLG